MQPGATMSETGWMLKLTWTRISLISKIYVSYTFLSSHWQVTTVTQGTKPPSLSSSYFLFIKHSGKWTTKKATFVDPITTWTIKINVPFLFYCFSLLYHYYSSKNDILPSNINDHSCFTMWQVWMSEYPCFVLSLYV